MTRTADTNRFKSKAAVRAAAAALLAVLPFAGAGPAAALEPRAPAAKQSYDAMRAVGASERVTVKFREGRKVRKSGQGLAGLSPREARALASALSAAGAGGAGIERLHAAPEPVLDAQRAAGEAESGRALADLNLYFTLTLPTGAEAAAVADRLNALPFVEYAAPAPIPAPPPVDIAPKTPDFVKQQGYLKGKSVGVGALSPKDFPGGDGEGLRVVDVEYSWRLDHEDLELPADRVLAGDQTLRDPFNNDNHGTAVLGEIVGKRNGYGVTGLAPAATAYVAPANTTAGYSPARAILLAGEKLRRGDALIIEQQYWVCGFPTSMNRYGPLETLQDVFDAVSTLTARGVIVLAAAGNGDVDLDAASCNGQFDRSVRDSGAIIVGAGASSDHSRLFFSSYGSRVDVQGWGENVTTTGYGGLFAPDDRQTYTATFNGTSSATPIVTGAALAIQGVRRACGLKPLSPAAMRTAMIKSGIKQGGDVSKKIGPLPRILPALKTTNAKACVEAAEARAAGATLSASAE